MNEKIIFNNFNINDYNNFNLTLTNNKNFKRNESEETLEIYESPDIKYRIKGIENIKKFNKNNSNVGKNIKIEIIEEDEINGIYDYDYKHIKYKEEELDELYKFDKPKQYEFYKDIEYENEEILIRSRIIKKTRSLSNNIKESRVFKEKGNYLFEIEIKKEVEIDNIIKQFIFAINGNIMSLKKEEQKEVLKNYKKLTSKLFNKNVKIDENEVILITPKPITLERINIPDKEELGMTTIKQNYAVTEKADGERYLLYIDSNGKGYLINNTSEVRGTKLTNIELKDSLYDGELILCNNRKDKSEKDLFAIFDIYIKNNENVTKLPLISDKSEDRYKKMLGVKMVSDTHDFMVKEQETSDKDIFEICNKILTEAESGNKYKYSIDGLIFTPTKLPVLGNYANIPVEFAKNMKWDKVLKWKPPEQNTIDFIIKDTNQIKSYRGNIKFKEYGLYVGYDSKKMENIEILDGLETRYDYKKLQELFDNKDRKYDLRQFVINDKPQYVHIEINEDGNCYTEESEELIENESVIEFSYDNKIGNISNERKWKAHRTRPDKNRIYNYGKGIVNKTANDWDVAMNIWRSITNPVSINMIKGIEKINFDIGLDVELTSQDKYYNRGSEKKSSRLISSKMNIFHNHVVKKMLYESPNKNNNKRGNLLELACGQGSDINRWNDASYDHVIGIDYVKDNITNPISGIYSRYIDTYRYLTKDKKSTFPEMLFLIGDCGKNIKTGQSAYKLDKDSERLMKVLLNENKKYEIEEKYKKYPILKKNFGKGFDVVSCMFSIHYFFTDEKSLDGFLKNVQENLKINGKFICTFMDGKEVETLLDNNNNNITGVDKTSGSVIWAIKRDNKILSKYGRKINVFIENTGRFILENLVDFSVLQEKCLKYGLELEKSEMFETIYNEKINDKKFSEKTKETLLEIDDNLKKFSFLNRWCIFKRISLM
tara:strand:- start:18400 stop:21225 length:2826 start_codon:yes stop_codon:yes gene_type:complete